jgi:integrase
MLYLRGRIWWLKFEHNGAPVRISTSCSHKTKAEKEARQLRAQYEKEHGTGGGQGATLDVIEDIHIQALKDKGRDYARVDTVENLWRNLFKHLGGEAREVATLTLADVQAYEGKRREEGSRGQTIRREVQALIKGLKLAKRDGIIARLPFNADELDTIESDPKDELKASKPRTAKEIRRVIMALSLKAKRAGHDKMLRFIQLTGLRLEEFHRYDPSWLRGNVLSVPTIATKTGRVTQVGRDLPLTPEARAIAKQWGGRFAGKKFNHAMKLASKRAGVFPQLSPRDIRATYITEMARRDPAAAQYLAGHTSLATTAHYVRIGRDDAVRLGAKVIRAVTGGRHRGNRGKRKAQ